MDKTTKVKVTEPRKDYREGKKQKRFPLKSLLIRISLAVVAIIVVFAFSCTPETPTIVTFPDANLEAAIRDAIKKPTGSITTADLEDLTQLTAFSKGITDGLNELMIEAKSFVVPIEKFNNNNSS